MLLLPAGTPASAAQVSVPTESMPCALTAWLSYRAKAPVALHATPSRGGEVLGHLPAWTRAQEERPNVEFDVVAARSGWLRIAHVTDEQALDADGNPVPPRAIPTTGGWIEADAAQVGIQSSIGYARPDPAGEVVVDLGEDWLTDMGEVTAIRGCAGPWLLIEYRIHHERAATGVLRERPEEARKREMAWFRGVCSNQLTTCDQASVDVRK